MSSNKGNVTQTGGEDVPAEKQSGEAGAEDVDKESIIALSSPKERVERCQELGKKIYAKYGISESQEVVDCEASKGLDKMEILKVDKACEIFERAKDEWSCAMTYEQLAWCFEGAPECKMAKQMLCGLRLESCASDKSPKTKPSAKALVQDATHFASLGKAKFDSLCKTQLAAERKDLGLKTGDTYACEGSSKEVAVLDVDENCDSISEALDLDAELCDLRYGDLMNCFSVQAQCNPNTEYVCSWVVSTCSKDGL